MRGADLSQEDLSGLPLACMQGGLAFGERLNATVEQTNIAAARMKEANLNEAKLQLAHLYKADLQGADLREAQLDSVDMKEATLSDEKYGPVMLADVIWGEINLAVVDWTPVTMLGDERKARQQKTSDGTMKAEGTRINEFQTAVRANRQLGVVLRDQGMNEVADRFAYRAQLLQRKVFWRQHELGRWLFSMLLALLSGYGYRIWRILAAYIVMVSLFALAYFVLGMHYAPHMPLDQAFLESITAFHGRVFLEQFSSNTPQIWLTALEAIVGLIIEGVFIAMLIQRFFSK